MDATRAGLAGAQETALAASLPVAAGIAAALTAAAVILVDRGWRLRQ